MNFRIIFHLLKTDFRRLRWLLLACWAILLLASWPALSFSPESFDMPSSPFILADAQGGDHTLTALEKQGMFSKTTLWTFITFERVSIVAGLLVAGCLGFHSRAGSEGRPVRRRESFAAKTLGLLLFLVLPLALLATIAAVLHGVPLGQALLMGAARMGGNLPTYLGVMLFGAYCGRWWTWLAGMFGMFLFCTVLPLTLRIVPGPDWFPVPFTVFVIYAVFYRLKLWLAVAVLAILLWRVRRDMPGARRVGIALAAILAACQLTMFFQPSPDRYYRHFDPLAGLPDWSATLKPELDAKTLEGSVDRGVASRGAYTNSLTSYGNDDSYLNLRLPWKTGGLPAGAYVTWAPVGSSRLKVGDTVVSRTPDDNEHVRFGYYNSGSADEKAMTAVVKPEGGKLNWDSYSSNFVDTDLLGEILTPIKTGMPSEAQLEMSLQGTVTRLEKVVDVPLGRPVTVKAEGVEYHIRRLDLEGSPPIVDLCYLAQGLPDSRVFAMNNNLIPVIYFPTLSIARRTGNTQVASMQVAPGLTAVRQLHVIGDTPDRKREMKHYGEMRFMLIRARNIATAKAEIRTPALPLHVNENTSDPERRDTFDPPAFNRRPDPATATPQEFEKWMSLSYSSFDRDWGGRNIADYVPRYMDRILRRPGGIHPPSTAEGRALELACPESRKQEVIDALLPANRNPGANWIPDLLISRGWVEDAKPQVLQMLPGNPNFPNVFTTLMVANLEDPQTYPALLEESRWFDTYEKLRLLPGIEPLLTESVAKAYRQADEVNEGRPADERFYTYLMPAAHGMPEALDHLIAEWEKIDPTYRRTRAEELRKVIQLPGAPDDWRAVLGALAGRKATDFRYDPLGRMWQPVTTP